MHLLKRVFLWLQQPATANELFNTAEHNAHCARDIGISVNRIRLPSGEEVLLVEDIREPAPEGHTDLPSVEAQAFIDGKTGP